MRSNLVYPAIVQPRANPVLTTSSTARRLITGRTPGMPKHTGQTTLLGSASW